MAIIFIDNRRKYKFMVGYHVKIGNVLYKILGIDELRHPEPIGSVAATTATTKDFDTYLKPLDRYIYFIEDIGIDGLCGFQLQFPKGIPHGTTRGQTIYIYADEASKLDPKYMPFVITTPNYPTLAIYNPTAAANNSDAYFFGERWLTEKVPDVGITPYVELMDLSKGGIGQG